MNRWPLSEPGRLAAAMIVLLVGATAAAFFVAQRLKAEPPLLRQRMSDRFFSPNGDGVKDTARIRFNLPRNDDVTVTILDEEGGRVARVVNNRAMPANRRIELHWDGHTDDGELAPEGEYRVRVSLRRQGRTNTLAHTITLDLTPPELELAAAGAPDSGPVVLDGRMRRNVGVRLTGPARDSRFSVWRTDAHEPERVVRRLPARTNRRARWDGRIGGDPAPPGTYLVAAQARDRAGNLGSAPAELPPPNVGEAPGGVGVTVRPLAIRPVRAAVTAGSRARVTVEAAGRRYDWALRRVGAERRAARGRSSAERLAVPIPRRGGGAYVLTVGTGEDRARALIPVAAPQRSPVLVVLPHITWQGRNDVDDTGDGLPDTLPRNRAARLDRPFARGALPRGFGAGERPLLEFLRADGLRHDVTTDFRLARSPAIELRRYDAVVLAGDTRWLPRHAGGRLRRFVERGGRLAVLGFDSLRRTVALEGGVMRDPSEPSEVDFLRARVGEPVRDEPISPVAGLDEIGLFAGTGGGLGTWEEWQATETIEAPGELVASGGADGRSVFVAYELGEGLVIRPGVRGFTRALGESGTPAPTMLRRIWTLLRD